MVYREADSIMEVSKIAAQHEPKQACRPMTTDFLPAKAKEQEPEPKFSM
jgi:hypothetical protein